MTRTLFFFAVLMVSTSGLLACGGSDSSSNGCPSDTPATCGDGMIQGTEQCDPGGINGATSNFGAATCATQVPGTMGSLQCSCCLLVTDMCVGATAGTQGGAGG